MIHEQIQIRFSDKSIHTLAECQSAAGMEHKYPSVDCGDVEVCLENDELKYLEGKDSIRWDEIDVLIDYINEASQIQRYGGLPVPPPDGIKKYLVVDQKKADITAERAQEIFGPK